MTRVKNREEVEAWSEQQLQNPATYLVSIKDVVPGATYSDGTPRTGPLTVGWRNPRTGDEIRYEFDVEGEQRINESTERKDCDD